MSATVSNKIGAPMVLSASVPDDERRAWEAFAAAIATARGRHWEAPHADDAEVVARGADLLLVEWKKRFAPEAVSNGTIRATAATEPDR